MILPVMALILLKLYARPIWLCTLVVIIIAYGLIDTIIYLLELIVLADI